MIVIENVYQLAENIVQSIIQRAFELAQSGTCRSMIDIERKLRREGFERVDEHLSGVLIRKQLVQAIKSDKS